MRQPENSITTFRLGILGMLLVCLVGFIAVSLATQRHLDGTFPRRPAWVAGFDVNPNHRGQYSKRDFANRNRANLQMLGAKGSVPMASPLASADGRRASEPRARHESAMTVQPSSAAPLKVSWITECGCTGMQVEANVLTYGLTHWIRFNNLQNQLALAMNKCADDCSGYQPSMLAHLNRVRKIQDDNALNAGVNVLHFAFRGVCGQVRDYGAWEATKAYRISRSMTEKEGIDSDAAARCNQFDEVWVPSASSKQAFVKHGVASHRIFVIPEAVDPEVFKPKAHAPLLPKSSANDFVFLSVFKFEERKNWKGLVDAFVREFHYADGVGVAVAGGAANCTSCRVAKLLILTKPYAGSEPKQEIRQHIRYNHPKFTQPMFDVLVTVREDSLAVEQMPALFASADAFVLPSRGEGWGLPLMEAMSMQLPTIGTDFGGNLAFMDHRNSFLVNVSGFSISDDGEFRWADPDTDHLQRLMRTIFESADSAAVRAVALNARQTVVSRFSPHAVGGMITKRLEAARIALDERQQRAAEVERERESEAHDELEAQFQNKRQRATSRACVKQTVPTGPVLLSHCSSVFGQAQFRSQCPAPCLGVLKQLVISCDFATGQFSAATPENEMNLINQLLVQCGVAQPKQRARQLGATFRPNKPAAEQLLDPAFNM